mmetsp:Transcript_69244/g.150695  ORF Transcript_69244/g.150695 Transcript_69244/m.150695 type:complete len:520 (+) Transcript_69244:70-1629(+)
MSHEGKGKGRGKGKGKTHESNEEAMLRMMSEGQDGNSRPGFRGKGKGKGTQDRGYGKGSAPPSTEEIAEERRAELRKEIQDFFDGSESQLAMAPSLNGLERKYAHEVAANLGLTTQSFGQARERYICLFKSEGTADTTGAQPSAAAPLQNSAPSGEMLSADASRMIGPVYTSVVLSGESQKKLQLACGSIFSIPHGWSMHCEHMTVCMGPLSNPTNVDNRSVGESLRQEIAAFQEGKDFVLRVVSKGSSEDVMALGVVGCASCNRNPHITVATAPGTAPMRSNLIQKWQVLPPESQLNLSGRLVQRGVRTASHAVDHIFEDTVRMARAYLAGERCGRPRNKEKLVGLLRRRVLPLRLFLLHPERLAEALELDPSIKEPLLQRLRALKGPSPDPLELCVQPFSELPEKVTQRAQRDLARLQSKGGQGIENYATWVVSQAHCRYSFFDPCAVVNALVKDGTLRVDEEGKVEYCKLGADLKSAVRSPYTRPWPLPAPQPSLDSVAGSKAAKTSASRPPLRSR